jgi:hypothetical protein
VEVLSHENEVFFTCKQNIEEVGRWGKRGRGGEGKEGVEVVVGGGGEEAG